MKIAVLISGGVDSAVTVDILSKAGHDLTLFYIRIGMDDGRGDCAAEEDIEMCTLIARRYGLPFHVVSLQDEYWDNVMQYALYTVRSGLTPHPDMMCNKIIKFGYFQQRWGKDFDMTATGHYASIVEKDGLKYLATAVDPVKDQTDFLAQISYEQLDKLIFPLGSIPKEDVRRLAQEANLPNATRKDSQGICFLGKIDYADFLRRELGERPGPVIEIETGRKIGTHQGFWFYTIGQRKGLGLSGGPWYVVGKNVRDNVIFVSGGYDTALQFGRELHLESMHWITRNPMPPGENEMRVTFKNRHTPHFSPGTLLRNPDNSYLLISDEDIQGVAPGQFAVIYDNESKLCYGSGMITSDSRKRKQKKR